MSILDDFAMRTMLEEALQAATTPFEGLCAFLSVGQVYGYRNVAGLVREMVADKQVAEEMAQ